MFIDDGIAVTQLTGQLRPDRDAAQLFHNITAHIAGMIGRTAGGDHDLVDTPQLFIAELEALQYDFPVLHPGLDGSLQGPGLLHNLFEHEMLIATLFRRLGVPHDPGQGLLNLPAAAVVDGNLLRGEGSKLPILQINDGAGMADEGGNIGSEEILPSAHAQNQRAGVLDGDQLTGVLITDHTQGVGTLQAGNGFHHSPLQVTSIIQIQQMYNHFCIGFAVKNKTFLHQFRPKLGIILDNAVMNHGKMTVVGQVGVGIGDGGGAVGGPAGMADAAEAGDVFAVIGAPIQVLQIAAALFGNDPSLMLHGDASRVIATIFQPFQAFQKYGRRLLAPGKADDSTHKRSFSLQSL